MSKQKDPKIVVEPGEIPTNILVEKSPISLSNWSVKEPLFKKVFFGISVLLLIIMPLLSFDYGITGDELVHKQNGENVLKYLATGGVDTTYRTYKNLYLYGGLFDASAAMIYENMPSKLRNC